MILRCAALRKCSHTGSMLRFPKSRAPCLTARDAVFPAASRAVILRCAALRKCSHAGSMLRFPKSRAPCLTARNAVFPGALRAVILRCAALRKCSHAGSMLRFPTPCPLPQNWGRGLGWVGAVSQYYFDFEKMNKLTFLLWERLSSRDDRGGTPLPQEKREPERLWPSIPPPPAPPARGGVCEA